MKKILFLLLLTPIVFTACKKKGCIDELANNFEEKAKKDDGSCTYNWDKFLGTYNVVTGTCDYPAMEFTSIISKGPNSNEIVISNFHNDGVNMLAKISGNNISYSSVYEVGFVGTGYVIDNVVTIDGFICEDYNWPDECDESVCSYTYTRQ